MVGTREHRTTPKDSGHRSAPQASKLKVGTPWCGKRKVRYHRHWAHDLGFSSEEAQGHPPSRYISPPPPPLPLLSSLLVLGLLGVEIPDVMETLFRSLLVPPLKGICRELIPSVAFLDVPPQNARSCAHVRWADGGFAGHPFKAQMAVLRLCSARVYSPDSRLPFSPDLISLSASSTPSSSPGPSAL